MSWLSNRLGVHVKLGGTVGNALNSLGNGAVNATKAVGHTVGEIASNPLVQGLSAAALAATGVGAPAAAAILAAEKGGGALLKPGGNIGQGIKGGITGAVEGYGASKLGGLARSALGSGLGIGSKVALGGAANGDAATPFDEVMRDERGQPLPMDENGTPYVPDGADPGQYTNDNGGGWTEKVQGILGKAGNVLGGGKMSGLDKILSVAGIANAAYDKKHQQDLENKAIDYSTDAYSARQPLRRQGLSLLQHQETPDLSFLENSANPYTKMHKVTPFNVSAKTPLLPTSGSY
jgi:hypothetical protein